MLFGAETGGIGVIKKFKNNWPIVVTWCVVLLLYFPFLSVYFTGDDFFHFKVAQTDGSIFGFLELFGFHPFDERGIAFYRPIFREGLYHIFYSAFGLSHTPFRIFQLLIHFVNISVVYIFFQKLFRKRVLSAVATFFYGITAGQVGSLYYLAGGIQAQGATLFMMLGLIYWLKYQEGGKKRSRWDKYKLSSFLCFILGLASHELAVVTVVLLAGLEIVSTKEIKGIREIREMGMKVARGLWAFFLVVLAYLLLSYFVIGFSEGEAQYQPVFAIGSIANSLMWYGGWSLGLPEMLVDFVAPGFRLLPNLMRYWGDYFKVIFPTFFGAMGVIGTLVAYLGMKRQEIFTDKRFWLLVLWFPIALVPVIFLPLHKKTYYLATALPAFWGAIAYLVDSFYQQLSKESKTFGKFVIGSLCTLLFVLSATSIRLSDETYWAAKRGRLAEKLISDITSQYSKLPKGATIFIKNDPDYPDISEDWGGTSTQANYILNGSDALQLVYKDFELIVYYEDLLEYELPDDKSVFTFIAEID